MKLSLAFLLFAASTEAFAPATFGVRSMTQLASRVDSTSLVDEALAASKKFGASSKEARLAWEAVEEVDSSDNSEATKGSLDDDCDIETIDEECLEYGAKLDELEKLLEASKATMASIESKAQEVKAIKIPVPQKKTVSADSPKLKAAVADAKKVTEEKGIQSPEAALAWETVEEIASADNSGAMGGRLTDECLVDATDDACKALEELNRVLKREA